MAHNTEREACTPRNLAAKLLTIVQAFLTNGVVHTDIEGLQHTGLIIFSLIASAEHNKAKAHLANTNKPYSEQQVSCWDLADLRNTPFVSQPPESHHRELQHCKGMPIRNLPSYAWAVAEGEYNKQARQCQLSLPLRAVAKAANVFRGLRRNTARHLPGKSQTKAYSTCGAAKTANSNQSPRAGLVRICPVMSRSRP